MITRSPQELNEVKLPDSPPQPRHGHTGAPFQNAASVFAFAKTETRFATDYVQHLALVGNHSPQLCGIATFTADTRTALTAYDAALDIDTYAIDDGSVSEYPPAVTGTIIREHLEDYRVCARTINDSGAQLAWLQHEYGIFGGADGQYILAFIDALNMPLAVTLHTVLEHPSPSQRDILLCLAKKAELLIVMAEHGRNLLERVYGVAKHRIAVIPHGIPDRSYVAPDTIKPEFGLDGRKVVLTFGLLSHDKGINFMIDALPAIVRKDPSVTYIILGATHPHLLASEGEALRHQLEQRVRDLGMRDHVLWVNDFVELDELTRYLQAADVYVTPYLNPMQVTSGTLSYATGLGKPVVSTPYVHATELLIQGNGTLVPFEDSAALATEIVRLLSDDETRGKMAAQAYRLGRTMTWDRYAGSALERFGMLVNRGRPALKVASTKDRPSVQLHSAA